MIALFGIDSVDKQKFRNILSIIWFSRFLRLVIKRQASQTKWLQVTMSLITSKVFKIYCYNWLRHWVKSVQIRSYFWSVFSHILTEYGEILRISPYSVRKTSVFEHFSRSASDYELDYDRLEVITSDYKRRVAWKEWLFWNERFLCKTSKLHRTDYYC